MDIVKELREYKKQTILEWCKKNKNPVINNTYKKVAIMKYIRKETALKFISKNPLTIKNYDDFITILRYL